MFLLLVLQAGCPGSVGVIAGNCRGKVKSLLFPGAGGSVVSNDFCTRLA